jgi:integrase
MAIPRRVSLVDYALTVWDWENSLYVAKRRVQGQSGISRGYIEYNRAYITNYAKRFFGKILLSDVRSRHLESFLLHLKKENPHLTNRTINRAVRSVVVALKEAYRLEDIATNPVRGEYRLPEVGREKGIFTRDEMNLLQRARWPSATAKLAFDLASVAGLRLGEIRGLQIGDLQNGKIVVRHSFSATMGLKCPKNGKSRLVPVPDVVLAGMRELADRNPHQGGFVFFGRQTGQPTAVGSITNALYQTMEAIGIPENARKERNLSFHSLRHFANTRLREVIPDNQVRQVLGHLDPRMTDRYDHQEDGDGFEKIRRLQTTLLGASFEGKGA